MALNLQLIEGRRPSRKWNVVLLYLTTRWRRKSFLPSMLYRIQWWESLGSSLYWEAISSAVGTM